MIESFYNLGFNAIDAAWWNGLAWPVLWNLLKIVAIVAPLMIAVAYLTLWERKLLGWMQVRYGPNRVGPWGLLQPMADGLKLLTKEIIRPSAASFKLYLLGPVMAIMPALVQPTIVKRRRVAANPNPQTARPLILSPVWLAMPLSPAATARASCCRPRYYALCRRDGCDGRAGCRRAAHRGVRWRPASGY